MSEIEVSILICTFGDERWERLANVRARPSAIRQGGSREVVSVHQTDGTLAEVRNAAAAEAEGEWLCFLDADDELRPGYVAAMGKAFRTLDWTEGPYLLVPAVEFVRPTGGEEARVLNDGRPLDVVNCAVIGTLIQREFFLGLGGFRSDLSALEDWELWLRASRAGATLIDVPKAVYRAWLSAGSRNADQGEYQKIRAEHAAAR